MHRNNTEHYSRGNFRWVIKEYGNDFEKEFAEILSKEGYWVLLVTPKGYINSQPMDIVACKNNTFYAFECKTVHSKYKRFPLSRLEQNQILAYKKLKRTGNNNYYLVVKWNDEEIYQIPFSKIDFKQNSIELTKEYKIDKKND